MTPGIQEAMRILAYDYDLPGPFTVLQGIDGDGMANTIDTMPDVIADSHDHDSSGSVTTDAIARPSNDVSDSKNSISAEEKSEAFEGDLLSIAGSVSETSSLELVTHGQASNSSYHSTERDKGGMSASSESEQQNTAPCLSPRRDDQPATGLHRPLPPGIPSNGYNSILPLVGFHLSPRSPINNADSFVMIDGKRSASVDSAGSDEPISPASSDTSEPRIDIGRRSSNNSRYGAISTENREAIKRWNEDCRKEENMKHDDVFTHLASSVSSGASSLYQKQWWKSKRNCLCVFDSPPKFSSNPIVKLGNIIGELSPGTTIMGVKKFTMKIPNNSSSKNPGEGWVEVLKIESPMIGYVVYSVDGYPFIGPGLPSSYSEPDVWLWKVTCTNGAYVRQGLELMSVHVDTIPFGSFVRVKRKTINAMGLTRLQIEAFVTKKNEKPFEEVSTAGSISNALRSLSLLRNSNQSAAFKMIKIVGWVSEVLNPLSGQTGPIVKPVPFPVPVQFRIALPDGAVIRQNIELSSNQIGHAPMGTMVTCVQQAYSQNPTDRCIQRLQLAGGGGWVSVKLNRPPPSDQISVLEQIDINGSFGPDEAGLFHIERQLLVIHEYNMNIRTPNEEDKVHIANVQMSLQRLGSCVSSIHDDCEGDESSIESSKNTGIMTPSPMPALYRSGVADIGRRMASQVTLKCGSKAQKDDPCLICLSEDRNATIVHGETGHIACCLTCARLLKGRGDKCPVCRLPIDLIIQQFWA